MENPIKEISKFWDSQPFLEKLIFLMNKFNFSEEEATNLAKLDYSNFEHEFTEKILNKLTTN